MATSCGDYELHSRQVVSMVPVKRSSSVPPPVLSSAGGGAKATITCTTLGSLATSSSVGEFSHLPSQDHTSGLSIASALLTSTWLRGFVAKVVAYFTLEVDSVSLYGGAKATITCTTSGPVATSSTSVREFSHLPSQGRVGGLSIASGSLTSTWLRGFMAEVVAYFTLEVDSSPLYHLNTRRVLLVFVFGQSSSAHWLAHYDYDLKFRRRPAFAVNSLSSEGRWNFIVTLLVSRCAARFGSTLTTVLYATQAYASTVHAFDDKFVSLTPIFFAGAMNVALARATLGWNPLTALVPFVSDLGRGFMHAHKPSHLLFWVFVFARFQGGLSVCLSCSGNDPNCPGDNTCALAKALVANVAVMAGTAGAAQALSMGEDGKHILPLPWLQFLKPSILQTLVRLAQKKPAGTPVDLPSLKIKELSASISCGSVSVQDGRLEFLRRMSEDTVSSEDLLRMKTICEVLPQRADDSRYISPLSKLSSSGALQFVYALATQIVRMLSSTSKVSLSMGDSSSASSSQVSVELKRPLSIEAFLYSLTVWQTLLSATGLANMVVSGPFVCEVVHDIIPSRGWKVALEHFLIYLQKIDSGVGWQLASATSLGSHDTFMHKALCAAGELGKGPPQVPPSAPKSGESKEAGRGAEGKISWNGKFNDDSNARPCAAFNLGQDHKNLKSDGSCPFNHICDQWVSDKGKGGQCKLKHSRSSCTNPAKAVSKSE